MSFSEKQVIEALAQVKHPKEGTDIVTMKIVQNLTVEGNKISYNLHFKNVNDPLKKSIQKASESALKLNLGNDIEIASNLTSDVKIQSNKPAPLLPNVKNIIAVASGKGGVGKSTVASNLAVSFALKGYKTGLIDADVYGPSVPKMFGVEGAQPYAKKENGKDLIVPIEKHGVKLLSIGFFVATDDAMIWRGPMASNAFKQLITDSDWGELDYLFIDLPPGTSDIHLTLVQTLSVTGAVIVSTPQDVALADALKGINMFRNTNINVPVLGLIENMAWFTPAELPNNKYYIFGKEGCKNLATKLNVPFLGEVPIVQGVREGGDKGIPAVLEHEVAKEAFQRVTENTLQQIEIRNESKQPTKTVKINK